VTSNATSAPPLPGRRGSELQLLHGLLLRHAPDAFDHVIEATLAEDLDAAVAAMASGMNVAMARASARRPQRTSTATNAA